MTIHASLDTLSGQLSRPLNRKRSIADVKMVVVADQLKAYAEMLGQGGGNARMVRPETEALQFYMLEHAAGEIRSKVGDFEPLGDHRATLDKYNTASLKIAARAYYYLLLICWREARHCTTRASTYPAAGTHVGVDPAAMHTLLSGTSDIADMTKIAAVWAAKGGDITLGQLVSALVYCYRKGKWGSVYGGPKWAVVAECLENFVYGRTSAAMMLDTVWALAHNTAPIFNKGMLYSGQDKYTLLEILDVQRAGLIPQYVLKASERTYRAATHITATMKREVQTIARSLEGFGAGEVNWVQVKNLGAVGSYSHYADALQQVEPPKKLTPDVAPKPAPPEMFGGPIQTFTATQIKVKTVVPGVTVKLGRVEEAA